MLLQNGQSIISGWSDGKIRAFGPQSAKLLYTIHDAHQGAVTAISGTPDSTRIISGGEEGMVRMWAIHPHSQVMEASMKVCCSLLSRTVPVHIHPFHLCCDVLLLCCCCHVMLLCCAVALMCYCVDVLVGVTCCCCGLLCCGFFPSCCICCFTTGGSCQAGANVTSLWGLCWFSHRCTVCSGIAPGKQGCYFCCTVFGDHGHGLVLLHQLANLLLATLYSLPVNLQTKIC